MKTKIYTDGACRGNPGPGGWGALLIHGDHKKEIYGYEENSTNNKMELMAVIQALELLKSPCDIVLTSDSKYVLKGINEWIEGWKVKGWKTAAKKDVKNKELWIRLDNARKHHQIEWKWVKGHSGHPENERVDALANKAIDEEFAK